MIQTTDSDDSADEFQWMEVVLHSVLSKRDMLDRDNKTYCFVVVAGIVVVVVVVIV